MPSYLVAALESQGRVLLAALGERSGDRVRVTTEDGRTFDYPGERLLWTARALRAEGASKREVAAALKVIRARAGPAPDWEGLRSRVAAGAPLDLHEVSGGGEGKEGDLRTLALAARAAEAAPFFRVEKGRLVAATDGEVRAETARRDAERRARESGEALAAALAGGTAGPPPDAAAPALLALLDWALGPEDVPAPPVAKRLGLADVFEATERIDTAGLLPADALPSLSRRGIVRAFGKKAQKEAQAVAEARGDGPREDLREVPAFALDDPETVEVDDALSCVRGPGGEPRLLVHIADAAAAVAPGGALDLEARRRATTVYLPDARIPMLPPDLTAARLSLEEGRDREALTAEFRLAPCGAPECLRLFRSVVRVTRRLDYHGTRDAGELPADLRPLLEMAMEMRRARIATGARVLDLPAAHLRVRDGVPVLEARGIGGAGDVLVAEAMVAFNRAAAERLRAAGAAALWRTQEEPRGDLPPEDDPLFAVRARRLFAPVKVALEPGRHAGLGVDAYLQATSPIRRYADLLHQRQLAAVLENRVPPHSAEEVRGLAADLWQRERLVRAAEAEREDYWMAVLLEARRAEVFRAFVCRPAAHGRGRAWIPALLNDYAFRWPKEAGAGPAEGSPLHLRAGRLARHRGRVEFDTVPDPKPPHSSV